jgi:hypothetical protein
MPWDEALVNSLVYDKPDPAEGRVVTYVGAVREALALALEHDPAARPSSLLVKASTTRPRCSARRGA